MSTQGPGTAASSQAGASPKEAGPAEAGQAGASPKEAGQAGASLKEAGQPGASLKVAGPATTAPAYAAAGRLYSGQCSFDRALGRYDRLIDAGIDVFGTQGYANAKVKTLCQRAGLSERYFYESFESREELLTAVYDHLATTMLQSVKEALKAPAKTLMASVKAGTGEVVDFMLGDPRHARIILVEIVGISPELEAKRHQSLNNFADVTMYQLLLLGGTPLREAQERLAAHPEDQAPAAVLDFARLTAVSVVGGVNNMLLDSLHSGTVHNTQGILDVSCQLISNAALSIRALAEK